MDHRGLRARLTGAGCTPCGAAIPVDRIAVLADRGDLAFIELSCPACGSRTLGVVITSGPEDADPVLDGAAPDPEPRAGADPADGPPLAAEDVVAMRRFLATWEGDLRSLLDRPGDARDGAGR
jgi:hypothetical protein